jgi:hypothetical protein
MPALDDCQAKRQLLRQRLDVHCRLAAKQDITLDHLESSIGCIKLSIWQQRSANATGMQKVRAGTRFSYCSACALPGSIPRLTMYTFLMPMHLSCSVHEETG